MKELSFELKTFISDIRIIFIISTNDVKNEVKTLKRNSLVCQRGRIQLRRDKMITVNRHSIWRRICYICVRIKAKNQETNINLMFS